MDKTMSRFRWWPNRMGATTEVLFGPLRLEVDRAAKDGEFFGPLIIRPPATMTTRRWERVGPAIARRIGRRSELDASAAPA